MTVHNSSWNHLSKVFSLTLLSIPIFYCATSQDWSLISEQKLEFKVEVCSIDRFGNIYLSDSRGNIRKLDPLGNIMAQFAPPQYGELSVLESWATLRIFLFYDDLQQYGFLDRFLNPAEFLAIPPNLFGLIILAAPSSDNQLWLLDSRPLNLYKFDINFNSITLSQPLYQLSDTSEVKPYHLIEYQNRVYLGDGDSGILVFDNLGNYLQTLPKPGAERFYPWRETLYHLSQNKLRLLSIYDKNEQVIELPDPETAYRHVLISEDKVVLLSDEKMFIYRYTPL